MGNRGQSQFDNALTQFLILNNKFKLDSRGARTRNCIKGHGFLSCTIHLSTRFRTQKLDTATEGLDPL